MGIQVVIMHTCDWCKTSMPSDSDDAPQAYPWAWDGAPLKVMLCEGCKTKADNNTKKIRELSVPDTEVRRKASKRATRPPVKTTPEGVAYPPTPKSKYKVFWNEQTQQYDCPFEGCARNNGAGFKHPASLGNHHSVAHGVKLEGQPQ